MWFRNLRIYRFTRDFDTPLEELEAALGRGAFRPCTGYEPQSIGWEPPLGGEGAPLVHAANGCLMICARREDKILPAAVVREYLEERLVAIQAQEGRPPAGRRARQALREEIVHELLPKAFGRSTRLHAYLDPVRGWLVVDSPNARRAEEVLSLLREGLGSLPVRPVAVRDDPSAVMTAWLLGSADSGSFSAGDECELREPSGEGAVVRCRRQDLGADEIRGHLDAGKRVRRLAVSWAERLSCRIEEDLAVKQLRFSDVLVEEGAEAGGDDAAARFDADFALMSLELRRFIPALLEAFGGEADSD
ncbi:MAG: recombination-associated protein RdgC [Chromatiales bacterium]|jgi:recombination associated protein RdgC